MQKSDHTMNFPLKLRRLSLSALVSDFHRLASIHAVRTEKEKKETTGIKPVVSHFFF
jgi:hypothetical protein